MYASNKRNDRTLIYSPLPPFFFSFSLSLYSNNVAESTFYRKWQSFCQIGQYIPSKQFAACSLCWTWMNVNVWKSMAVWNCNHFINFEFELWTKCQSFCCAKYISFNWDKKNYEYAIEILIHAHGVPGYIRFWIDFVNLVMLQCVL